MNKYMEAVGSILTAYYLDQLRLVRELSKQDMDNPVTDLAFRHEIDKLNLLEAIMIDAGADIKREFGFSAKEYISA